MGVIRRYDESDARRDALVEAMKRHVRAARPDTDYDADIEYIEHAIVAFTDEQLRGAVATLTSVRVWAEIVRDHNSDEHIRRHMRMLLGLLDGEDPDTFGQS
jgi:hypothetical protein